MLFIGAAAEAPTSIRIAKPQFTLFMRDADEAPPSFLEHLFGHAYFVTAP